MIISISGFPGSGKSTVAKLLAKKLGFKRYYMGGLRRQAAKKRGLTIEEYNKLGETDSSTDTEIDQLQKHLGETETNFIIEGRTSFYFIPHSIKIYIDVAPEEAARRIFNDHADRNEKTFDSVDKVKENILSRVRSDTKRYKKYYSIDCYDTTNYDLVIDSTQQTPEQVLEKILEYIKNLT